MDVVIRPAFISLTLYPAASLILDSEPNKSTFYSVVEELFLPYTGTFAVGKSRDPIR